MAVNAVPIKPVEAHRLDDPRRSSSGTPHTGPLAVSGAAAATLPATSTHARSRRPIRLRRVYELAWRQVTVASPSQIATRVRTSANSTRAGLGGRRRSISANRAIPANVAAKAMTTAPAFRTASGAAARKQRLEVATSAAPPAIPNARSAGSTRRTRVRCTGSGTPAGSRRNSSCIPQRVIGRRQQGVESRVRAGCVGRGALGLGASVGGAWDRYRPHSFCHTGPGERSRTSMSRRRSPR